MRDDAMKAAMALCGYIEQGDCTPEGVESRWRQAFTCALRDMGFSRKQRQLMWGELAAGNWERLHLTDRERELPTSKWLDTLRWDAFYCSDRWSLDRIMRCHWVFRQYMEAATGESWWPR